MPTILKVSEYFRLQQRGLSVSISHAVCEKLGQNEAKRFESKKKKCTPMLIKACEAPGLIELHRMSNLRQGTFIF